MDDGELERLVDEAVEVLAMGLGSPSWIDGESVRRDFVAWFGRCGLDRYAKDLGAVTWRRGLIPGTQVTALWRRRLREGIDSPSNIAAASELRALIDRLSPAVLPAPKDGASLDTGLSMSLPTLPEPTGGDLIDFRSGTFTGPVVGVQHVSNTYGAPPPSGAQPGLLDWPLAKDVEPRTHGVRPTRRMKGLPALPPYVGRDQDRMANWALEQARSEGGLVIVLGQAYSGKSRTALAAMAQVLPEYRVFAPAQHEDLRKLPAQLKGRTERCVVWLDDLDVHLGSGGLEPRLLGQLTEVEAVVLATMREEAYAKYARRTSAQGRLLGLAQLVELPRAWGPAERKRAEETGDSRLIEAARESGTMGVATYLAIGPRLWNDWQLAPNRERHPRAHALVRAAVDLARCGLKGPLPQDLLVTVHEGYGIAGLERESLEDAWEWAGRKRYGVLHMLSCGEGEQGRFGDVLPYFVHTAEQDEGFPPVAGWVWGHALDAARANPATYDVEKVVAGARTAYMREAEAGDAWAMHARRSRTSRARTAQTKWSRARRWPRQALLHPRARPELAMSHASCGIALDALDVRAPRRDVRRTLRNPHANGGHHGSTLIRQGPRNQRRPLPDGVARRGEARTRLPGMEGGRGSPGTMPCYGSDPRHGGGRPAACPHGAADQGGARCRRRYRRSLS